MTGSKSDGDPRLRTPMHWARAPHVGFSNVRPWEPLHPDSLTANVEAQDDDPASLLNHYRRLIHIRTASPALAYGDLVPLETGDDAAMAFLRRVEGETALVLINLGAAPLEGPGQDVGGRLGPQVGIDPLDHVEEGLQPHIVQDPLRHRRQLVGRHTQNEAGNRLPKLLQPLKDLRNPRKGRAVLGPHRLVVGPVAGDEFVHRLGRKGQAEGLGHLADGRADLPGDGVRGRKGAQLEVLASPAEGFHNTCLGIQEGSIQIEEDSTDRLAHSLTPTLDVGRQLESKAARGITNAA